MYLPDFDYYAPETLAEACQLLAKFGSKAKVLSGGTDVLVRMKNEEIAPEVLVSIKNLEQLRKIEYVPGKGIVIGARTTHNDLVFSELLQEKCPSIPGAARQMAHNQVRNVGTVGGNIVNAVPSADLPPILIALDATVNIIGSKGERSLPLEDIFTGPKETCLANDEIVTEVIVPELKMTGSTYMKFGLRAAGALAVAGVASAVRVENDVIKDVRIVLSAVAPTPMRAKEAEKFLIGKKVSDEVLAEAGKIAAQECKPITDYRASAEYRRNLVNVFTKRSLRKAIDEGHI